MVSNQLIQQKFCKYGETSFWRCLYKNFCEIHWGRIPNNVQLTNKYILWTYVAFRGGARKVPTGGPMPPTGGLTILVPEP